MDYVFGHSDFHFFKPAERHAVHSLHNFVGEVFQPTFGKRFFWSVGTKVRQKRIIAISYLDIIRDSGLALNLNDINNFVCNQCNLFLALQRTVNRVSGFKFQVTSFGLKPETFN